MTPKLTITVRHERSADFAATEAIAHNARVTELVRRLRSSLLSVVETLPPAS